MTMAAAYVQPHSAVHSLRQQHHVQQAVQPPPQRRHPSKQRFLAEFSQCLFDFVIQLLPTPEELAVKEDVRKLLERLIRTIEPESRLLSFGSTANGFSLRNSDMDLCCLIDSEERLAPADLVTMLGDLLERETKFHVKGLPYARIPIVKLSLDPSPGLPFGIACDIGFENRLALENTRLLMCYAMIDPPRVRTMVLFLKVWCKRRKINSPYKGTLSSYGYVLLVIFFLVHVKNPPVLPNLQQMPPLRPISQEESTLNGHNIWFFDDINLLRQRWQSQNTESVAELLVDFFKFYSRDFAYNTGVASIRAGLLKKDSKGWQNDSDRGTLRERNRLCIEDPFETDFNVSRCVTRDGLYTIRGELMRASRILAARPDRAIVALAQLCEERKDEELLRASPSRSSLIPPRLSPLPPQTPYTVGSKPMRAVPDRLSPPQVHEAPSPLKEPIVIRLPPDQLDHMAPKRAKWTSPPPPEAPEADRTAFEDILGQGLVLATSSMTAREKEQDKDAASSNNSEVHTDDEERRSDMAESDDVRSIKSYNEETSYLNRSQSQSSMSSQSPVTSYQVVACVQDPSSSRRTPVMVEVLQSADGSPDPGLISRLRGRPIRLAQQASDMGAILGGSSLKQEQGNEPVAPPPRIDTPRRSLSGPPRSALRLSMPVLPGMLHSPLASYPSRVQAVHQLNINRNNVYYETSPLRDRLSRPVATAQAQAASAAYNQNVLPPYRYDTITPRQGSHSHSTGSSSPQYPVDISEEVGSSQQHQRLATVPQDSTTPSPSDISSHPHNTRLHSHSHTHSTATITARTPPPSSSSHTGPFAEPFIPNEQSSSRPISPSPSISCSPGPGSGRASAARNFRSTSPFAASVSSASGSPSMSCSSSQYAASLSPLSTSPPSPTNSDLLSGLRDTVVKIPPATPDKNDLLPPIPMAKIRIQKEGYNTTLGDAPRIAIAGNENSEDLVHRTEGLNIGS